MKYIGKIWMLALPLMLAGCSKDEVGPGTQTGGGEIAFEIGFTPQTQTRVATGAAFNSSWEDGDHIGIFAVAHGEPLAATGNYIHNVRMTYTDMYSDHGDPISMWSLDEGTALYWPQDGTALDFYAYYPYDATFNPAAAEYNVMLDQSGETDGRSDYNVNDWLTAKANNNGAGYAKGTTSVPLEFSHAMAMVQTTLDNETGLLDTSSEITVTLKDVQRMFSLNLVAGEAEAIDDKSDITMHRVEQLGTPEYETTYTYRALLPAGQTFEVGTSLFRITDGTTILRSEPLAKPVTLVAGQVEKFGQQMPIPLGPKVEVEFTEGESITVRSKLPEQGLYMIDFGGTGSRTVYYITIDGRSYFIGRKDNETVMLKLDADGNLQLREAVDDGSGTPRIPIGTFAELQMIGLPDNLGGNYLQEGDLDLFGILDAGNLDQEGITQGNVSRHNWTPIGYGTGDFTGSYDGGGHDITNLYIRTENYAFRGLFATVYDGGSLSNIRIVSASVTGSDYVGAVCGNNRGGTIDNCYNAGVVTGIMNVGGVCGYNTFNAGIEGYITGCFNMGRVTGTNHVGGVCGVNHGIIDDCHNTRAVKGTSYVGGVCGQNYDIITACDNRGEVTATGDYVGGVCGDIISGDGSITQSYNTGAVSGNRYVGGVCGNSQGDISDCDNEGKVEGKADYVGGVCGRNYSMGTLTDDQNRGTVSGVNNVGGVCGMNSDAATTTGCSNSGSVTGTDRVGGVCGNIISTGNSVTQSYNTGAVNGRNDVGGVCGRTTSGNITSDCYNTGPVEGTNNVGGVCGFGAWKLTACHNIGPVEGTNNVGGVCGSNDKGTIEGCSNTGAVNGELYVGGVTGFSKTSATIRASKNSGAVTGDVEIGGVCGRNEKSTITACYNTGLVAGTDTIGGVCGSNNDVSTIIACYNTGFVAGEGNFAGVSGINSASIITGCYFLQHTYDVLGVAYDNSPNNVHTSLFGDGGDAPLSGWPTTDMEGWATGDGTIGYWKALSPNPLGGWVEDGNTPGINSTFPRLWWEE